MKTKSLFFVVLFLCLAYFVPLTVGAQPSQIVPCEGACQACHIAELGDNVVDYISYAAIAIATLIFVFAGFKYLTAGGDSSKISEASSKMGQVFLGVVIIFVSWIIINTLMTTFVNGQLSVGVPWSSIECVGQPEQPPGGINFEIPNLPPGGDFPDFDIGEIINQFPGSAPPQIDGIPIIGDDSDEGGSCRGQEPFGSGIVTGLPSFEPGAITTFWHYVDSFSGAACSWTCAEGLEKDGATCSDPLGLIDPLPPVPVPDQGPPEWGTSPSLFTLVNADTNSDLGTISEGEQIPLNDLPTSNLNIRADFTAADGNRFEFAVNGALVGNEVFAPYAVFGDEGGDYNPWTPSIGSYDLTAQPYIGADGYNGGTPGTPVTVNFDFYNWVPSGDTGTTPPDPNPDPNPGVTPPDPVAGDVFLGAIGCSQTRDVMDGYRRVGGTDAWSNAVTGDLGGRALTQWADLGHMAWDTFDAGMAEMPETNVLWWEICLRGLDRVDSAVPSAEEIAMAETVINEIQRRAPGVSIYVSGQNEYDGHVCPLSGANGPAAANALADHLANTGQANRGPVVGPLNLSQVTQDNCHANIAGEDFQGQQLLDWVNGLESGGIVPPTPGDDPAPTPPPPSPPPVAGASFYCGDYFCQPEHGEDTNSCPWDCTPYTVPKAGEPSVNAMCERTYTGFVPLTEVGADNFAGVMQGGLYPGGSNVMPAAHRTAGEAAAARVAATTGDICLVSIGMSNTNQKWEYFLTTTVPQAGGMNSQVVLANGAIGSMPISEAANRNSGYWGLMENQIENDYGCTLEEVRAVWLMHAMQIQMETDSGFLAMNHPEWIDDHATFTEFNTQFKERLRDTIINIDDVFPNVEQIFISSRTYAGYGSRNNNPEPYAYWGGYTVKDLIDDQINGTDAALTASTFPWIGWGPYLWADGLVPRESDGLTFQCSDFQSNDGIHPLAESERKTSDLLFDFFMNDSTASWFGSSQF